MKNNLASEKRLTKHHQEETQTLPAYANRSLKQKEFVLHILSPANFGQGTL